MVSVIMPCYNDGLYIEESVQSILGQTFKNIEIIIVDDGSKDPKTLETLEKLSSLNVISVFYQENQGPSVARNLAVSKSVGEFILPHDADDYFDAKFIEEAVKVLESKPDIGVVTCGTHCFDAINKLLPLPAENIDFPDLLLNNTIPVSSLMRRECWVEVSGWDESIIDGFEDWEFWIRVCGNGWKCVGLQEHLFHYRIKKNSRNKAHNKKRPQYMSEIVRKNSDIYQKYFPEIIMYYEQKLEEIRSGRIMLKILKKKMLAVKAYLRKNAH